MGDHEKILQGNNFGDALARINVPAQILVTRFSWATPWNHLFYNILNPLPPNTKIKTHPQKHWFSSDFFILGP